MFSPFSYLQLCLGPLEIFKKTKAKRATFNRNIYLETKQFKNRTKMSHHPKGGSSFNRSTASTHDAESPAPRAPQDTRRQIFDSNGNETSGGGGGMSPAVKQAIGDIAASVARGEQERSIMNQHIAKMAADSGVCSSQRNPWCGARWGSAG